VHIRGLPLLRQLMFSSRCVHAQRKRFPEYFSLGHATLAQYFSCPFPRTRVQSAPTSGSGFIYAQREPSRNSTPSSTLASFRPNFRPVCRLPLSATRRRHRFSSIKVSARSGRHAPHRPRPTGISPPVSPDYLPFRGTNAQRPFVSIRARGCYAFLNAACVRIPH